MFKKRNSAPLARVVTPSRARARSEQGADMAPPLLRLPPRSPIPCLVLKVGSDRLLLRGTGSGSRAPGLPQQTTALLAALRFRIGAQLAGADVQEEKFGPVSQCRHPLARAREHGSEQGAEMA